MKLILALVALTLLSRQAQAYALDMKGTKFAIDLGGTFGSSSAGDGAYAMSSGYGTVTDHKVQTATSAEFSFVIAGERAGFRLGGEYLMPRDQAGVNGTDASGNSLFSLHSTITALIPEANIEIYFARGANSHAIFGLGYGMAFVSLTNQYTMTSLGQSELGAGSYNEVSSATANLYQAYLGWEFVFTDTVMLALSGGYRYLVVPSLQATQNASAIYGAETSGSNILNEDGGQRSLNLSGGFAGVNLRFYF